MSALRGAILDFWGHGDEGIGEGQKALDIDPNYLVGLYLTGAILTRRGRHDATLPLFARALEISERAPFVLGCHGCAPGDAAIPTFRNESVVAQISASSNRLTTWLRQVHQLRRAA